MIPAKTLPGSANFTIFEPSLQWTDLIPSFVPDSTKGEDDGAP